ncbi:MAG: hypothetical protein L0346_24505 [Chloroflexi bacterium]|nr:hypothetical protein [Chloroflexota bacterium]
MIDIPNIFDLLARFAFLRGAPAAVLVLLTAAVIFVVRDWRWSLLALAVQYLVAGLLFADLLDPRLAVVKSLVGLFICLILHITARQVNWGRLPADITPQEAARLRRDRTIHFGRYRLPTDFPLRLFLALMVTLVVWAVSQRPAYHLPIVPDHFNLAVYALVGMGLAHLSLTTEPLRAGMGLLTFLTGFELYYSALEQSLAMLTFLAVANLVLALVIAALSQARHAYPALLD